MNKIKVVDFKEVNKSEIDLNLEDIAIGAKLNRLHIVNITPKEFYKLYKTDKINFDEYFDKGNLEGFFRYFVFNGHLFIAWFCADYGTNIFEFVAILDSDIQDKNIIKRIEEI